MTGIRRAYANTAAGITKKFALCCFLNSFRLDSGSIWIYTLVTVSSCCKCLLLPDMQLKQGRVQMSAATRNAAYKSSSSNVSGLHSRGWSLFYSQEKEMETGHFYYIDDSYFVDFPDPYLMKNKEAVNGQMHDRPCFYAFLDGSTGIYWMIPFSSQISKFKKIYSGKIQKYKRCDTIVFGEVLGYEKAFLIQNMCPITSEYIKNEYIDAKAGVPVRVNGALEKELKEKASKVLALQRQGSKLIFPNVLEIETRLINKNSGNSAAPPDCS